MAPSTRSAGNGDSVAAASASAASLAAFCAARKSEVDSVDDFATEDVATVVTL